MSDLQAMVAQHPLVAGFAREVRLGAAVLEDLEQHGPAQDVWMPLVGGKPARGRTCEVNGRRSLSGEAASG